jgi:hypothetical protein
MTQARAMTASGTAAVHHDHEDEHHDHDDDAEDDGPGPADDPRWVLVPLVVGLVIGLILAIVFGFGSGVPSIA